jgi:hypothetical protein
MYTQAARRNDSTPSCTPRSSKTNDLVARPATSHMSGGRTLMTWLGLVCPAWPCHFAVLFSSALLLRQGELSHQRSNDSRPAKPESWQGGSGNIILARHHLPVIP